MRCRALPGDAARRARLARPRRCAWIALVGRGTRPRLAARRSCCDLGRPGRCLTLGRAWGRVLLTGSGRAGTGLGCGDCRFRGAGIGGWACLGRARRLTCRAGIGAPFGPGYRDECVQAVVIGRGRGLDDYDRDGLRIVLDLTDGRPCVCVGHARHNAYPRRAVLPVVIRPDILTAAALRTRFLGEWSCTP